MQTKIFKKIPDRSASKAVQLRKPYEGTRNVITDEENLINKSLLKPMDMVQLNELKPILEPGLHANPRKVHPVERPATMKPSESSKLVKIDQSLGAEELMYTEAARGYIESGGNIATKRQNVVYMPPGPPRDGYENDYLPRTRNETSFVSYSRSPIGLREREDFLKIPVSMKSSDISRAPSTLPWSLFDLGEKTSSTHLDRSLQDQEEASIHAFSQESASQRLYRTRNNPLPADFSQVSVVPITNDIAGTSLDTAWVRVIAPFARASRRKPSLRSQTFLQENLKSFLPTIDDAVLSAVRPIETAVSLRKKVQLASLVQGLTKSNPIASAAIASAAAAIDPRILSVNAPHKLSNKGSVALNQRPLRMTTDNIDLGDESYPYTDDAIIKSAFVSRPSYKSTPTVTAINFNPTTTANTMADAVEPDQAILGYTKTIARDSQKTSQMNITTMGAPNAVTTIEDAMDTTLGIGIENRILESKSSTKAIDVAHTTDATTPLDVLELEGASTLHFQPQSRSSTKQMSLTRVEDATVRTADWEATEVSNHLKIKQSSALLRDTGKRATMATPIGIGSTNNVNVDNALTEVTMSHILHKPKSFDAKTIGVEVPKRSNRELEGTTLDLDDFNNVTMLTSPLVMERKVRENETKRVSFDRQLQSVVVSDVLSTPTSNTPVTEVKRPYTAHDVVIT